MSGFFGLVRQDGKQVEREFLERIARELSFRGPDGTGVWISHAAGGCYASMRTGPASQSERQSVALEDRYWLLGDVRLDGRRELQEQLSGGGGTLPGDLTSEELLLRAWRQWGEVSLERLLGDFSFALWDQQEQCLWCARDFVGARPLYYSVVGGVFCFSNTLQVLRSVPEVSPQLDELFVGDFLLEGWGMDLTRTVYRDIRRLPAGHVLKFSRGQLDVKRFVKLPIEEPLQLRRPEEYVEAYRELLTLAVKDRLPETSALYLSGGLDSSSVSAIAARLASERGKHQKLKAFTIGWEPLFKDDEASFARLTAEQLGVTHEVLQDPDDVLPYGEDASEYQASPEPNHELFSGRAQRCFRRIAEFARVVLSGDGGDNVLTGQAWPYLMYMGKRGKWGGIVRSLGGYIWTHGRIPPLRGGFRSKVRNWFHANDKFADFPHWLNEDFEKRVRLKQRWLDLRSSQQEHEHPVHPEAYASLQSGYWSSVLEGEDPGWTRLLLETRAPLLDLRVLRFLLRVPPIPWCLHKELARKAMVGYLPDAVLERPKTPMVHDPLEACIRSGLWKPELPKNPPERIFEFINWSVWQATLGRDKGSLNWVNLRPLSLVYWLKGIENSRVIE